MDDKSLEERINLKGDYICNRILKKIDIATQNKAYKIFEKLLVIAPIWLPVLFALTVKHVLGGHMAKLGFLVIVTSYLIGLFALFRMTKPGLIDRFITFITYTVCIAFPAFFTGWFCLGTLLPYIT